MNRIAASFCVVATALMFALPAQATRFRFPVVDTELIVFDYVVYSDHDPQDGEFTFDCLPWCAGMPEYPECVASFPYCYDAHDGTDFMLLDGFSTMDMGSTDIVAAADGDVIATEDGNYDRCMADLLTQEIDCDGHPMRGNYVKLRHADGMETWYWHMMSGSVAVQVGDTVKCGDPLGKIGSSGYSSGPHLHFEVRIPTGVGDETIWIDPFAGLNSQPESYWVLQRDPTTWLPGAYCEGDEIPDFPEPDGDTGSSEEVVVAEPVPDVIDDGSADDAGTDAGIDAEPDVGVDTVQPDSLPVDTAADAGPGDLAVADSTGDARVDEPSSGDVGFGEVTPMPDLEFEDEVGAGSGGGCQSGADPSTPYGLLLMMLGAIFALVLHRRGLHP